jgi:hypothetical protein
MESPLSGQCLCPGLANFGGKYFCFPPFLVLHILGYSHIVVYQHLCQSSAQTKQYYKGDTRVPADNGSMSVMIQTHRAPVVS